MRKRGRKRRGKRGRRGEEGEEEEKGVEIRKDSMMVGKGLKRIQ